MNNNIKLTKSQNEMLERIQESLESGNIPWLIPWENGTPFNGVTEKPYSGMNLLNLSITSDLYNFNDPRWYTFRQANEIGAKIKKGSKGTRISFFSLIDPETNKSLTFKEYNLLTPEEQDNIKKLNKEYIVYNGSQINGLPPFEKNKYQVLFNDEATQKFVDSYIEQAGINFVIGNSASYGIQSDSIIMPDKKTFKNNELYYGTLMHEMAHSTGHEKRLNRDFNNEFGSEAYAIEELRAEVSSLLLGMETGVPISNEVIEQSGAYIKSWMSAIKKEPQAFLKAIKDGVDIKNYIIKNSNYKELEHEFKIGLVQDVELDFKNDKEIIEDFLPVLGGKVFFDRDGLESIAFKQLLNDTQSKLSKEMSNHFMDVVNELIQSNDLDVKSFKEDYLQMMFTELKNEQPELKEKTEQTKTVTKFSREELEMMKASVPITEYAKSIGFNVIQQSGDLYTLEEHNSVKIYQNNNSFFRFSNRVGGTIIDFIKEFEDVDTKEAIEKLTTYYKGGVFEPIDLSKVKQSRSIKSFSLPTEVNDMYSIGTYLKEQRGIDSAVYNEWVYKKYLYEDVKNNCVFVGKNAQGIQSFATLRGTGEQSFRGDVAGSKKEVAIYQNNNADVLIVNEAPIDTMSYQSLIKSNGGDFKRFDYLSLCGTMNSINAIKYHMEQREEGKRIKRIVIALDNDEAGIQATETLKEYINENYNDLEIDVHFPSSGKDFNDQLLAEQESLRIENENELQMELF